MKLKRTERYVYPKNPLEEVVCQIRFFPILKLQKETPSELQELLASDYPKLTVERPPILLPFSNDSEPISNLYIFQSSDDAWKVSVFRDFFGLTCIQYKEYKEFKERLIDTWNLFYGLYPQANWNRIGLRYRNIIDRKSYGVEQIPWDQLIKPIVSGPFGVSDLTENGIIDESDVIATMSNTRLKLDDAELLLQAGLLRKQGADNETAFMIDGDCYVEHKPNDQKQEIGDIVDKLHDNAGSIFGACITDRLREALKSS